MKKDTSKETPESKLAEISKEIIKVEKEALTILVTNEQSLQKASLFLTATIKPRINRIEQLEKFFTEPYVEQRRTALLKKQEIEEMFSKQKTPLMTIESRIKRSINDYYLAKDVEAKKEEVRLMKLRETVDLKREKKVLEPIIAPIQTVVKLETSIKTEAGVSSTRKIWKFEIVKQSDFSKELVIEIVQRAVAKGLVDTLIRQKIDEGIRTISGVKVYEDYETAIRVGIR